MEGRASGDEASSTSGSDAETEIGRGTSHIHSASDEERELERFAEELNREILNENTIESSDQESEEEDSHLDLGELAEMTEVLNKKIGIRSSLRKPKKKSSYFEVIHDGGNGTKKYSCLKCGSVFKNASSCIRHFKESCKNYESYSKVSQNEKLREITLEPQDKNQTSKKSIETPVSSCSSSSSESSCDSESESESKSSPIVSNEVKIHPTCSPPVLLPSTRLSKSSPASGLSCSSRDFQARSKKELDRHRHLESHLRRKCFMCPICRCRISWKDNLKRHIVSEHCRPGCGHKELEQIYPQMYAEHEPLSPGTWLGRKMFMCPICKARHLRRFQFRRHLESRHCGPERSIEEVEQLYPDLYYNLHEAVEGEAGDISRMTMSLEESVASPSFSANLLPPLRTPISGNVAVEGEARDTSCVETIDLDQNFHLSKKTTNSCSECGFLASNRYSLELHFHSKHTLFGQTTTEFPCSLCGKIFPEKLRLKRHLKRCHKVTLAEVEAGVLKSNGTSVNSTTHAFPVSNIVDRLNSEERVKFTVVSRMENCRVFHLTVRRDTPFIKVMRSIGMKLKKNTKKLTFSRDCDDSEIGKHCTARQLAGIVIVVTRKDK